MFIIAVLASLSSLVVGTLILFGKLKIADERKEKALIGALTLSAVATPLAFILPKAEPPELIAGWFKKGKKPSP